MSLRKPQRTLTRRRVLALAVTMAACVGAPSLANDAARRASASAPALRLDADDSSFGSLAGWIGGFDTWRKQFEHTKDLVKANPQAGLVFIGDSLTQNWGPVGGRQARSVGESVWTETDYDRFGALNLGIAGDQTQNVLYRIEQGQLDGLSPGLVVLMVGTNNLFAPTGDPGFPAADYAPPAHAPEEVAAGILAIVEAIQKRLPEAHVLTLGVVRGKDGSDPDRIAAERVNLLLSESISAGNDPKIHFLDLGKLLYQTTGAIEGDGIHLASGGYEVWGRAIAPWVERYATPINRNSTATSSKN
jgi:lysophospholipase L1-like esterase